MCTLYTIFSVVKLDLYIRALLLDHILARENLRVRLTYILLTYIISQFALLVGGSYLYCFYTLYTPIQVQTCICIVANALSRPVPITGVV